MTLTIKHSQADTAIVLSLPRSCWGCQALLWALGPPASICASCNLGITPLDPSQAGHQDIVALYAYQGVMAQLLTKLKFQNHRAAARPLGELLCLAPANPLQSSRPTPHIVTVPLHWKREMRRGFNQCDLILDWAYPHACRPRGLLKKCRTTRPQQALPKPDRQDNLVGAFRARQVKSIDPKTKIVVLDDVTTTGTTLKLAIAAVKAAGYPNCTGLALMRANKVQSIQGGPFAAPPSDPYRRNWL